MEELQSVYLLVENVPYVTFERVQNLYLTKEKALEYFRKYFPNHDYRVIHRIAE